MKKKIYIIIPLIILLVCTINVGEVSADVQINAEGTFTGESAACGNVCCENTQGIFGYSGVIYGMRMTLYHYNSATNKSEIISNKLMNFWSTDEVKNLVEEYNNLLIVNGQINNFVGGLMNPEDDIDVENQYKIKYKTSILTEDRFNNATIEDIFLTFKKNNALKPQYSSLEFNDIRDGNYYILIEPVFAMHLYNRAGWYGNYNSSKDGNYVYIGTAPEFFYHRKEIFRDSFGNPSHECFEALMNPINGTYVFDKFLVDPFVNDKNLIGINYIANESNYSMMDRYNQFNENADNKGLTLGWSKAIINIRDYTTPPVGPPDNPGSSCTDLVRNIRDNQTDDIASTMVQLLDLYQKYPEYKGLLNFAIIEKDGKFTLDLKNVSCNDFECESDGKFDCKGGTIGSHKNVGCYYEEDSNLKEIDGNKMYCNTYYITGFDFSDNYVKAGNFLWSDVFSKASENVGIGIKFECVYYDKEKSTNFSEYDLNRFKTIFGSNISLSVKTFDVPTIYDEDSSSFNYVRDDNGYMHYFSGLINYKLNDIVWYSNGSNGVLVDGGNYEVGNGIPIALNAETGKYDADIVLKIGSEKEYTTTCPYYVDNEIMDVPNDPELSNEFNFGFRIIDTDNPFAGASGNGRNWIGSNWCLQSFVGFKIGDYLIGDVNLDGNVDIEDVKILASKKQFVAEGVSLLSYDFDGDGTEDSDDSRILQNKLLYNKSDTCHYKGNQLVKKYITDAKDSYSTEKPMYTFTLNSSDIKAIRQYNENHSYSDFNLNCDTNGDNCKSDFLTSILQGTPLDTGSAISKPANDSYLCYDMRINNSKNSQFCSNSINNESK